MRVATMDELPGTADHLSVTGDPVDLSLNNGFLGRPTPLQQLVSILS